MSELTPEQKAAATIVIKEYRYNLITLYLKNFILFCVLSLANILFCSILLPDYKLGIQFTEGLTVLLMMFSGLSQASELTTEFRSELAIIFEKKD